MNEHAAEDAKGSRKDGGESGPSPASRFFSDSQQGCGAGPVHEGEGHRAECSAQAPAVGGKERFHFHETFRPGETAFCQVSHDDDGKDDLVGRESEDEGQEEREGDVGPEGRDPGGEDGSERRQHARGDAEGGGRAQVLGEVVLIPL